MITALKLDKFFNRGKRNEIHVINQISLDLPDHGLVVLFGPSGSGKTTLLNVLGGLDRARGEIHFNDITLNGYSMTKWDKIRNRHIGYIFQNYMLLENISIYENIKLTLNMIGITDKDEINKRVEYLLDKVGLKNYKKRKAGLLSGGQQQRVAIARALAKNPEVIIADEPTGNLDSKNTVDIMNIIKTISKEKLVLLVTHERELATFYADRIIELKDGQIVSDTVNTSDGGSLELKHETDIYLKDMDKTEVQNDALDVSFYSDKPTEKIQLRLVLKNGTLYLDVDQKHAQKVNLLTDKSEVKLIDDHYKDLDKNVMDNLDSYQFGSIIDETKVEKSQPVITWKHAFRLALNKIINSTTKRKFLFVGFILAGFLLLIAFGFVSRMIILDEKLFMPFDKNYVIANNIQNRTELDAIITDDNTVYVTYRPSFLVAFELPVYYQESYGIDAYIPIDFVAQIEDKDITYGRNVQNDGEILLDYSMFKGDNNTLTQMLRAYGVSSPQALLGKTTYVNHKTYTLVGFVDRGYNAVFMREIDFYRGLSTNPGTKTLEVLQDEFFDQATYPIGELFVLSTNPTESVKWIDGLGGAIDATHPYLNYRDNYLTMMALVYSFLWVFSLVIVIITLIALFFVLRASLAERITEIAVFRALGVRRIDIIKTFIVEIFVISTVSFIVGYIFGIYYFTNVNTVLYDSNLIIFPAVFMVLGGLFIYGVSQLIGLIPVWSLLRKTPAQIMSSYDL
jgi:ABC-type lipoprotein export system ATPase subunit